MSFPGKLVRRNSHEATPGIYFRLLFVGLLRGHRFGARYRLACGGSLTVRDFLGVGMADAPPDHTTISRARRLIDLETHRDVFGWVLGSRLN
jgi:transposase